ncbi:pitrilysin family protein [Moraxella canis]|uniref:Pitrilysin family protein n=1 Tax=Moraxella canis TaxID=90239 RepID=A0ABZ0WXT8_9GAMM|nr:pitrilysin family protein [Moraxella canis]WQE04083.1 pitrilysin family protein [Moraxella canis]
MKLIPLAFAISAAVGLSACQSLTPTQDAASTTKPTSTQAKQHDIYTHTLDNGLKVIIKQDSRAPIVMTQIWYDVGSSDEPVGKGGISHFLEHMMFKDAKGISHDDYQRLISHFGGQTNAFTSDEFTAYYESLPANQFPLALQIEANRMNHLILTADEVATEKQVIKEERRLRTDDNPIAKAYEEFLAIAMPDSPMGRPVIGSMADIEGIDLQDLQNWYGKWYRPNNATLVLVGDITPDVAMPWIEKYFKDLTPSSLPKRANLNQPSHRGYTQAQSHQNVQVPSLIMGFNVPTLGSQNSQSTSEAHALSLLSDLADGGLSARFERQLIRNLQVLSSVSIHYDMLSKGDGLFTIIATPRDGVSLQDAEAAILAELNAITEGQITDDELSRSRAGLLSSLVFTNDSIANQAISLGLLSTLGLPLETLNTLPQALDKISKSDIQAVGKKYITKDNLTTVYVLPNHTQQ